MSRYLNESGRHIVYSCEWPMYESAQGGKVTGNFRYFHNHVLTTLFTVHLLILDSDTFMLKLFCLVG